MYTTKEIKAAAGVCGGRFFFGCMPGQPDVPFDHGYVQRVSRKTGDTKVIAKFRWKGGHPESAGWERIEGDVFGGILMELRLQAAD